jgi:hypothetical protein
MKTSESIKSIAPALLAAQKKIGSAAKDAVNPFFKSKYADLGSVMEACKQALNENGISVLQPIGQNESGTTVETILLHESGEFISDVMLISVKELNNPQAQGSAITYARRYSLQSMMFIPAEDDDGEKSTPHKDEEKTKTASPSNPSSEKQRQLIYILYKNKNGKEMSDEEKEKIRQLNSKQASDLITKWKEAEEKLPEKDVNEDVEPKIAPLPRPAVTANYNDGLDEVDLDDIPFD